jgi:hypothetical protein
LRWAAHWPAVGDINRWDTHVVLVVDLASDRGSIPRASTDGRSGNEQRRPEMGAVARSGPVTPRSTSRPLSMERDDPMARVRERRFRALVDTLLPQVRRLNPTLPDDQVLEMAESMAELRLLDEEMD